jgi:hypothetical protein
VSKAEGRRFVKECIKEKESASEERKYLERNRICVIGVQQRRQRRGEEITEELGRTDIEMPIPNAI